MCKYKDTNLGIKKLDFGQKRGMMVVYLTDGRVVMVPVGMFPDIKRLTGKQREEWMILDFRTRQSHILRERRFTHLSKS